MIKIKTKLIPVAVLAHNEQDVIAQTLDSILGQQLPEDHELSVYVFANGCTDETEPIVAAYEQKDARVKLVSLTTKGKIAALKESIKYFVDLNSKHGSFDRVIYSDADIELTSVQTFMHLSAKLDTNKELYLVSSFPIMSQSSEPNWLMRNIFKAREQLQFQSRNNVVRGACYIIDFDVLQRINYPDQIVSDDMFLEVRLNGHTWMDYEHPVLAQPKTTLRGEIERDYFTLLARNQIYSLKRHGKISSLDKETAHPDLSLTWFSTKASCYRLLSQFKLDSLFFLFVWNLIHRNNQRRANKISSRKSLSGAEILGMWSTER